MRLQSDFDMVEYLNDLRESCLEAYTGIVQGLKGEDGQPSGVYNCFHAKSNLKVICKGISQNLWKVVSSC